MLGSWFAFSIRGVLSKKLESRKRAKKTTLFLRFSSCQQMFHLSGNCCFQKLCSSLCFSQPCTTSNFIFYFHILFRTLVDCWLSLVSLMISLAFEHFLFFFLLLPSFFPSFYPHFLLFFSIMLSFVQLQQHCTCLKVQVYQVSFSPTLHLNPLRQIPSLNIEKHDNQQVLTILLYPAHSTRDTC